MNGFVRLVPYKRGEFETLVELAKKDSHGVYVPTHTVKRDDFTLGYFSVGSPGVPIVFAWLDTRQVMPRESFSLINLVENLVQLNGGLSIAFPVPSTSPFHPLMPKMGYQNSGNYDFFVKKLT